MLFFGGGREPAAADDPGRYMVNDLPPANSPFSAQSEKEARGALRKLRAGGPSNTTSMRRADCGGRVHEGGQCVSAHMKNLKATQFEQS